MSAPRRVLRPGLTWPIVVGKPKGDSGGDAGGNWGGAGSETRQRELRVTGPGEGEPIPAVYGRVWVGGRLILIGKAGNDIVLAYAISLALNGIDAFEQILVDGKSSIQGVTVRSYVGTHTSVPTDIAAAYPGHTERYKGLALVTLRISPFSDIFGGIPEVRCLIRGRKVWDGTTYTYSDNPALIAYDIVAAGDMGGRTSGVDWPSFNDAASYFAAQGRQFAYVVSSLESSFSAAKRVLEAAEAVLYADASGTIKAAALKDNQDCSIELGDAEIVAEDGFEQLAQIDSEFGADAPNQVVVRFADADRGGEESFQRWTSPLWTLTGGPILVDDFQAPYVGSAIQAARIAENIGVRYLRNARTARVKVLEPVTPGTPVRLLCHGWGLDGFSSDTSGVTCTGGASEPTTALRIAAHFMLSSSSGGVLVRHGTPGTNGFELSASSAGLTLKVGATTTSLSVSLPVGVPVQVAVLWKADSGTVIWGINGVAMRSSIIPSSSAAASSNSYTVLPGFAGLLFFLQVYASGSAASTLYSSAKAPNLATSPLYIFGDGTAYSGSISGGTITKAKVGNPFWVTRCKPAQDFTYELELREWQFWSRADAQALSSNDVVVDRYDSKPALSLPDHTEVPPPPGSVSATATERQTSQGTQYEIAVTWSPSPSTFIRGYRVYCSVSGGQDRLIGEYGRNATGCQFWAFQVRAQHTITVTAISITGKESSGVSASVTPGTGALAVTSLSASWVRKEMGIKGAAFDKWYTGGVLTLSWSVTGSASQIVVELGGQVVARLAGTTRSLEVARGFSDGMYAGSGFGGGGDSTPRVQAHFDQGMSITVTAIASDGRTASASASVPGPASTSKLFSPGAYEPLIGDGGTYYRPAQYVAGNVPSAPSGADDWVAILNWQRDGTGWPNNPRWKRIARKETYFFNAGQFNWNIGSGEWTFLLDAATAKNPNVTVYSQSSSQLVLNVPANTGVRVIAIEL